MGIPDDFYDDPANGNGFPDTPEDGDTSQMAPNATNGPLLQNSMLATATYTGQGNAGVAYVFLQRLADPTQGWHPYTNPYISVDWSGIDVTVFSGEEDTT